MSDVKVKLLRALNGQEIGTETVYSQADAERLAAYGSVKILGPADPPKPAQAKPGKTKSGKAKAEPAAPQNKAEGASPSDKSSRLSVGKAASKGK